MISDVPKIFLPVYTSILRLVSRKVNMIILAIGEQNAGIHISILQQSGTMLPRLLWDLIWGKVVSNVEYSK